MRKLILVLVTIISVTVSYAQDNFSSVHELLGKNVRITSGDITLCTYIMLDGKIKPVKKDKDHVHIVNSRSYNIDSEMYQYKKDQYIVLKGDGNIYFFKESDAPIYLSYMHNENYWSNVVSQLNACYPYLDIEAGKKFHRDNNTVLYDGLAKLTWNGFQWNNDDLQLQFSEEDGVKNTISPSDVESLKNMVFISKDKIDPYVKKYEARIAKEKRAKEISDSICNRKLRLATVRSELSYKSDDDDMTIAEGDTVAIYSYNDSLSLFLGCYHYSELTFKEADIKFVDEKYAKGSSLYYERTSEDMDYLKKVGDKGIAERYETAIGYDTIRTRAYINDLKARIKAYNAEVSYMRSHQIFITKAGYNYDDEQFGMDFDIYNCFTKTIKYVIITLKCFNQVGDVQRDYFGYSTKTVRGIGPIEPTNCGSYSWEKIFWDEYDVIKNCKITNIKFIFKDGTSKSFAGVKNINSHFASDAWADSSDD